MVNRRARCPQSPFTPGLPLSARGIDAGLRAQRRHKPACAGILAADMAI